MTTTSFSQSESDCSPHFTDVQAFWPDQPAESITQKTYQHLSVGLYQRPAYEFEFHSPPEYIVHMRRSDTPWQEGCIDGGPLRRLPSRRGDLFLLEPDVDTYWSTPAPSAMMDLLLKRELLESFAASALAVSNRTLVLCEEFSFRDPLLEQICYAIIAEVEQGDPLGELYVDTLAHAAAARIVSHHSNMASHRKLAQPKSSPSRGRRPIDRALDYIHANLERNLTLRELAQAACLSPYHFARLFKQTTGQTPHNYVTEQRVERAKKLLANTDDLIAEVAYACGFGNQSHLTTVFRKRLGVTPRRYREALNPSKTSVDHHS